MYILGQASFSALMLRVVFNIFKPHRHSGPGHAHSLAFALAGLQSWRTQQPSKLFSKPKLRESCYHTFCLSFGLISFVISWSSRNIAGVLLICFETVKPENHS